MSDADIILIFIGIISLLIAFGQLIVAFRIQSWIGFAFPHKR